MPTPISGSHGFQTAVVTINDASNFVLIDTITIGEAQRGKPLLICGTVGSGGALASLKLTAAPLPGASHFPLAVDTDFNTATALLPFATPSPHQTVASGTFALQIAHAPSEVALYAKKASADTTVQLLGTILG